MPTLSNRMVKAPKEVPVNRQICTIGECRIDLIVFYVCIQAHHSHAGDVVMVLIQVSGVMWV